MKYVNRSPTPTCWRGMPRLARTLVRPEGVYIVEADFDEMQGTISLVRFDNVKLHAPIVVSHVSFANADKLLSWHSSRSQWTIERDFKYSEKYEPEVIEAQNLWERLDMSTDVWRVRGKRRYTVKADARMQVCSGFASVHHHQITVKLIRNRDWETIVERVFDCMAIAEAHACKHEFLENLDAYVMESKL